MEAGGDCLKEFTVFDHTFSFLTEERQWIKLQNYLNQYLFDNRWGKYAVMILAACMLLFLFSIALRGKAKKAANYLLLLIYMAALILLFIVGRDHVRGIRLFNTANYLTEGGFHETRVLISLINCLLFVPFGICLRKASGKGHAFSNVLLVLFMAFGLEIAQYIFARGYTALEDVLVYVIGGFAGLLIASPFCLISQYLEDRRRKVR